MNIESLSLIMAVAGLCVAVVNVIVEVLKNVCVKKESNVQITVLIVSELVSYFAFYVYCGMKEQAFSAAMFPGAFFCGFFIAYGAMFGYDNLYGKLADKIYSLLNKDDKIS